MLTGSQGLIGTTPSKYADQIGSVDANGLLQGASSSNPIPVVEVVSNSPVSQSNPLPVMIEPASKATYRISGFNISGLVGVNAYLAGSATKKIKITRIRVTSGAGTAAINAIQILKCSALPSATNSTSDTPFPIDSTDVAATANGKHYATAAPTAGTTVGTFDATRGVMPSATVGSFLIYEYNGAVPGAKELTLNNANENIEISFAVASSNYDYMFEWTEE